MKKKMRSARSCVQMSLRALLLGRRLIIYLPPCIIQPSPLNHNMNGQHQHPQSDNEPPVRHEESASGGTSTSTKDKMRNGTTAAAGPCSSPATSATGSSSGSSTSASSSPASSSPPTTRSSAPNGGSAQSTRSTRRGGGIRFPRNIDEYRNFLLQNQTIVGLTEDVLSRLILYAPSRFYHLHPHDDAESIVPSGPRGGGILTALFNAESLYALLNLWTLSNDVILSGSGDGSGLTIGTASEAGAGLLGAALGDGATCNESSKIRDQREQEVLREEWGEIELFDQRSSSSPLLTSVSSLLKTLPASLSTILSSNPTRLIIGLRAVLSALECVAPAAEVLSGTPSSSVTAASGGLAGPIHVQRQSIAQAHLRKMNVLSRMEHIKFLCRLCLLALNLVSTYRRIREDEDEDGQSVLSAGILSHGGMLCPGERGVPATLEEERLRRLGYVGRRTGRRTCPGGGGGGRVGGGGVAGARENYESSPRMRLLALTAGELLHIYRPLYWTNAERNHAAHDVHAQCYGSVNGSHNGSSGRFDLLKSWVISLAMDVVSHKLTLLASGEASSGIIGGLQHPDQSTKLPPATVAELRRRKMRWMLYLLRCPIWDVLTKPVAGGLPRWWVGSYRSWEGRWPTTLWSCWFIGRDITLCWRVEFATRREHFT